MFRTLDVRDQVPFHRGAKIQGQHPFDFRLSHKMDFEALVMKGFPCDVDVSEHLAFFLIFEAQNYHELPAALGDCSLGGYAGQ